MLKGFRERALSAPGLVFFWRRAELEGKLSAQRARLVTYRDKVAMLQA